MNRKIKAIGALCGLILWTGIPALAEPNPTSTYATAFALFEAGDYAGTLAQLDLLLEQGEATAKLYNLRGATLSRQKEWDRAAQAFEQAARVDTNEVEALFNLGEIRFIQQDYATARKAYATFSSTYPKNPYAPYRIFLAHLLEGDRETAKELLGTFVITKLNPVFYFAHAAWHFNQGEVEKADYFVFSARGMYPTSARAFYLQSFVDLGWIPLSDVR